MKKITKLLMLYLCAHFFAPSAFSLSEKEKIIKGIRELGGDGYQNLYKINGYPYEQKDIPSLQAEYPLENNTRCSGIKFILEKFFPHKKIKVLDIGTDTGYISHCLADNGLTVHGVDSNSYVSTCVSKIIHQNKDNLSDARKKCVDNYHKLYGKEGTHQIKIANLVKKYNKLKTVTFESNIVDLEYVKNLKINQYDCAVILAVLHWINLDFGLKTTKELLNELLKKVPIVIIEATQKRNEPDNGSKVSESLKALPEHTLEFFKDLHNLSHFEEIPKEYMNVSRPVYILFSKPLKKKINF